MSKKELRKKLFEYEVLKEHLYDEVQKYCQDKSEPLKDRWDIFEDSEMGNLETYIQRFHPIVDQYLDRAWTNRYQTVHISDIEEWYSENLWETMDEECEDEVSEEELNKQLDIDLISFREAVLERFIGSFILDW